MKKIKIIDLENGRIFSPLTQVKSTYEHSYFYCVIDTRWRVDTLSSIYDYTYGKWIVMHKGKEIMEISLSEGQREKVDEIIARQIEFVFRGEYREGFITYRV